MSNNHIYRTRRRLLTSVSAFLSVSTAGCSTLDPRPRDSSESTTATEQTIQDTESPTTTTESPTTPTTDTTTETTSVRTKRNPDLNETPYPVVQQQTNGSVLSEKTVILSSGDWQNSLPASQLTDEVTQFLTQTNFESSYVVGFEVEVTERGYKLRLEGVSQQSTTVRIEYSDAFIVAGPNVNQDRAMFVRLPRDDGVPESVVLQEIADEE